MIDAEDRAVLMLWAIRFVAFATIALGGALTLGLAWRLFEIVRG